MGKYLYVLMIDSSGTTHSLCNEPVGIVADEKEAIRFVKESNIGYERGFKRVKVAEKWEECISTGGG
ncbi:MAG: hypothetical protein ABFD75_12180 [Smithella sp.]